MDRLEIQERRAANLIWNAAGDYSLKPEYMAFDEEGRADLYFNSVIGAVYRYCDFPELAKLLRYFQAWPEGTLYCDLFWLGLEHSVYPQALAGRPALESLRRGYARAVVDRQDARLRPGLFPRLRAAHFRRVLGEADGLKGREAALLDALEFPSGLTSPQLVARMKQVINTYFFSLAMRDLDDMGGGRVSLSPWRLFPKRLRAGAGTIRQVGSWDDQAAGGQAGLRVREAGWFSAAGAARQREYVRACFGRSIFPPGELADMERALCVGNHSECRLHVTRGEVAPEDEDNPMGKHLRLGMEDQREANLRYYKENLSRFTTTLGRLTERIRNAVLIRTEPAQLRSREGMLQPSLLWRGLHVHDPRVFLRELASELGDLTVDILLDGSASQLNRQEKVAAQGYLIAESLTRCRIPVRVCSFCSVSGFTVLRIYRDYGEEHCNGNIFGFSAAGWNRDGLALRAMGDLMARTPSDHRLLIILSDASPNDDQKLPWDGLLRGREYSGSRGVRDVAREVSSLRRKGIWVMCVFTGEDRSLPAAQEIYGRDLARIHSVSWFADTVGRLLQERIQEI